MGIPSIGIYTYELYNFYDVETIIRVGSCGARQHYVQLGDIVIALGSCTESNYADQFDLQGNFAPIADFYLARKAVDACEKFGYRYHVGNVYSADVFYSEDPRKANWTKMGVLADEMEAPALYLNAARAGKKALVICTVSDHILTGEATTAEQRQNSFTNMMDVAFDII
jgi:purine-nucleoside phosphorylase